MNNFSILSNSEKTYALNPLTPTSDQDRISPYNINTISTRYVMRIKKNINLGMISWSNTKLSELTLWEYYDNDKFDLGVKGLRQDEEGALCWYISSKQRIP